MPLQRTLAQFLAPTSDCSQPLAIPKLQGTQCPLTSTGYQNACGVCKCIQAHVCAYKNNQIFQRRKETVHLQCRYATWRPGSQGRAEYLNSLSSQDSCFQAVLPLKVSAQPTGIRKTKKLLQVTSSWTPSQGWQYVCGSQSV